MAKMTQAEYARHRGISKQAIGQAVKAGRLTLVDGKLDPLVADVEWDARTEGDQQKRGEGNRKPVAGDGALERAAYFEEKRRREKLAADLLDLDLRRKTGELCLESAKDRELFGILRTLRDRILVLPDRVTPLLLAAAPDPFKTASVLDAELKASLRAHVADPAKVARLVESLMVALAPVFARIVPTQEPELAAEVRQACMRWAAPDDLTTKDRNEAKKAD